MDKLERFWKEFLWDNEEGGKVSSPVACDIIKNSNERGGFGIGNLK